MNHHEAIQIAAEHKLKLEKVSNGGTAHWLLNGLAIAESIRELDAEQLRVLCREQIEVEGEEFSMASLWDF